MTPQRRQCGFTLIEVLLSLVITGMLLASVAAVVHASLTTIRENDAIASTTQTARMVLYRMMREIRNADAMITAPSGITIVPASNPQNIQNIDYEYTDGQLLYTITINSTTTQKILIGSDDDVTLSSFDLTYQTKTVDSVVYTTLVTAVLTFECQGQSFTVSASAAPRRNMTY